MRPVHRLYAIAACLLGTIFLYAIEQLMLQRVDYTDPVLLKVLATYFAGFVVAWTWTLIGIAGFHAFKALDDGLKV